jgi:FtsZ-interacting cell division protein ZipA
METNWIFIIIVIVAAVSLVIFLIWRNQKDKRELMRKLNEEDHVSKPPEHDTEADQTEA